MKSDQNHFTAEKITCPACGLLCDDLPANHDFPASLDQICQKSANFFNQAYLEKNASPNVAGIPTQYNLAIQRAAEILHASKQPLIAGLGTEVQGMRALMPLARQVNATLDHMHSASTVHNTRAMQNSGWITTTFSEIKNRADLILVIGTDIRTSHPRFLERLTTSDQRLSNNPSPELIFLGVQSQDKTALDTDAENLPEVLGVVNAMLSGRSIQAESVAGIRLKDLQCLIEKLKNAKYAAIVWSTRAFNSAHGALTVEHITQLIAKLNQTTRAAGLPLNTGDGDTSVNQTSTWLCGYPTRIRFQQQQPKYDTHLYSTEKQINHCDALLWISTFNPVPPPQTEAPVIVIGHPATRFNQQPAVFIPVGVPGIDHSGYMVRMDSSITLPLKQLRESALPSLTETVTRIVSALAKLDAAKGTK